MLNDQVHAARYVRKGHTSSVATFVSPTVGPVGYLAEGVPVLPFTLPRPFVLDALPPTPLTARVALLTVGIGDDGGLLPAVRDGGYAGLVVAGSVAATSRPRSRSRPLSSSSWRGRRSYSRRGPTPASRSERPTAGFPAPRPPSPHVG